MSNICSNFNLCSRCARASNNGFDETVWEDVICKAKINSSRNDEITLSFVDIA